MSYMILILLDILYLFDFIEFFRKTTEVIEGLPAMALLYKPKKIPGQCRGLMSLRFANG